MKKPICKLIGKNGNIFNLVSVASKTLRENDMRDKAIEMRNRVFESESYDDALAIIAEYVDIK
jgi:hypothetical protein